MKKILIAEDEISLLEMFSSIVENSGNYKITKAIDGEEVIKKIIENLPDIILLDIMMPKKDGIDVLIDIKSNPKTKNIPVIILSNISDKNQIEKALDLGASDYLVKSDIHLKDISNIINKYSTNKK
ncbi:response regulator [Patescibacteria group bacterium]|nr:response regulator [Patescibacteria group bacterium]